ncbi:MAG: L,D-transpeptidase [Nitrospinales bacterium]
METEKLIALSITEYNLIASKNPMGSYDRTTRENLYGIIEKLRSSSRRLSSLEARLFEKFKDAQFGDLEEKEKKVRFEIARYRLSSNVKRSAKLAAASLAVVLLSGLVVYRFILPVSAQQKVEMAYYAGLNKLGLVSKEGFERIKKDLSLASTELQKTRENIQEVNQVLEEMILNNKITENLKYILKQIYQDPRAKYVEKEDAVTLTFDGKKIARYKSNPELWYLLGIVETGVIRVYYDNDEILEFRAIFGRKGEETPLGEYEIKNKIYKPTWYKKETVDGQIKVRAIPFGHPDHEVGFWWMGLKKIGPPVPGSYGIHGVNVSKVNEFYKKNFDWRNGSAGCPNVEAWYLHFLAKVLPLGTRMNIVAKDKWTPSKTPFTPPSAA